MEDKANDIREAVDNGCSNSDLIQMLNTLLAAERERWVNRGDEFASNVLAADGDKAHSLRGFLLLMSTGECGPNVANNRIPTAP